MPRVDIVMAEVLERRGPLCEFRTMRSRADHTQPTPQGEAKAAAFLKRSGTAWHMIFANGATETYTSAGANDDAMPTFHNSAGRDVKIAVSNDGTVMMIEPGCIRSGKLADNQVKNGQSQGDCTPAGEWTATVAN